MSINNRMKAKIKKDMKKYETEIKQFKEDKTLVIPRKLVEELFSFKNEEEKESTLRDIRYLKEKRTNSFSGLKVGIANVLIICKLRETIKIDILCLINTVRNMIEIFFNESNEEVSDVLDKLIYLVKISEKKIESMQEFINSHEPFYIYNQNQVRFFIDDFDKIFYVLEHEIPNIYNISISADNEVAKELFKFYIESLKKIIENIQLKYECICNYLD